LDKVGCVIQHGYMEKECDGGCSSGKNAKPYPSDQEKVPRQVTGEDVVEIIVLLPCFKVVRSLDRGWSWRGYSRTLWVINSNKIRARYI